MQGINGGKVIVSLELLWAIQFCLRFLQSVALLLAAILQRNPSISVKVNMKLFCRAKYSCRECSTIFSLFQTLLLPCMKLEETLAALKLEKILEVFTAYCFILSMLKTCLHSLSVCGRFHAAVNYLHRKS